MLALCEFDTWPSSAKNYITSNIILIKVDASIYCVQNKPGVLNAVCFAFKQVCSILIDKEYQKEGLGTSLTILDLRKSSFCSQNEDIPGGGGKNTCLSKEIFSTFSCALYCPNTSTGNCRHALKSPDGPCLPPHQIESGTHKHMHVYLLQFFHPPGHGDYCWAGR